MKTEDSERDVDQLKDASDIRRVGSYVDLPDSRSELAVVERERVFPVASRQESRVPQLYGRYGVN